MGRLRDELEPGILPRQLAELERVAARLGRERPFPTDALVGRIHALGDDNEMHAPDDARVLAWACLALGILILSLTVLFAL